MPWTQQIAALRALDPALRTTLERQSRILRVPPGTVVFSPGARPEHMLLLLSGAVRVQKTTESGREIVLYRIRAGESCVLTTACLLAGEEYTAEGIAESDAAAAAIPRATFDDLVARSPAFRRFVFDAYSHRITDLFAVVEDVAFGRLDIRLAQRLLALAEGDTVRATHQKMAAELGTAREVISRQLAEFQRRGWVAQGRGAIRLSDRAALAALAHTER